MENFWQKLKKPIIGMAPMDGVTDAAFRHIVCEYAKPDVIFTEFVPVDGICACLSAYPGGRGQDGAEVVLEGLIFSANERPIVAQIFGANPENFYKIAPFLCELGFDGIDINMGCPDKNIMRQGGGAALIGNPKLAGEIVLAVKRGVADWASGKNLKDFNFPENIIQYAQKNKKSKERKIIPVSAKTRIGVKNNSPRRIKEWAKYLAEMELDCVTIHGRTLKQAYKGKADWELIAEGAEIIKKSGAIVLGNGDIQNIEEAKEKARKYNLDGVLVGRAVMGNPLFFSGRDPSIKEKLTLALEHAKIYEKFFERRQFINMRKHLVWYASGFQNASDVRAELMKAQNAKECEEIIKGALNKLKL